MKSFFFILTVLGFLSPAFSQQVLSEKSQPDLNQANTPLPPVDSTFDTILRKHHELGITFSSLNSFGLKYKYGSEKNLFRLSVLSLNLSSNNKKTGTDDNQKTSGYGAGISLGWEHHFILTRAFQLYFGIEAGASYSYSMDTYYHVVEFSQTTWSINPSLSVIFGAGYTLNKRFVFSAEIAPGVIYSYGKTFIDQQGEHPQDYTINNLWVGISMSSANLTIAYCFGK